MPYSFVRQFGDYVYNPPGSRRTLARVDVSPITKAATGDAGSYPGRFLRYSRAEERRIELQGMILAADYDALAAAKAEFFRHHQAGEVKKFGEGDRYYWAALDGPVPDRLEKAPVWRWEATMTCGDPYGYDALAEKAVALPVDVDRDVVFVLDLSGSMTAGFAAVAGVSRFDAAVTAIRKAVAELSANPGNRFGLVVFGDDATLARALTSSVAAFNATLGGLAPTEPQTYTWLGIQLAQATLEAADTAGRQPVVMVLSDGQSLEPTLTEAAGADLKTDHPDWLLYAVAVNAAGFDPAELVYVGDTVGDGYFATADPGQLDAAASAVVPAGTAVEAGGNAPATPYFTFNVTAPGAPGVGRVVLVNASDYLAAEGQPPETFVFRPRNAGTHAVYFGPNCTDDARLNRARAHRVWHAGRDEDVSRYREDRGAEVWLRPGAGPPVPNRLYLVAGGGCTLATGGGVGASPTLRWRDRFA